MFMPENDKLPNRRDSVPRFLPEKGFFQEGTLPINIKMRQKDKSLWLYCRASGATVKRPCLDLEKIFRMMRLVSERHSSGEAEAFCFSISL
jgi:hypothetical protein